MMKVYVVTEQYNFDHPEITKVFAKQDDAEHYCDTHEFNSDGQGEDITCHWYEMEVE